MDNKKQLQKEFEEITRPVIKWLCENKHPHVTIIITSVNAQLFESEMTTGEVFDYLVD